MLIIEIPKSEFFNENTSTFDRFEGMTIYMEHSLVSLSKWESKWKKPFLTSQKTSEENLDYFKCMTITKNVPDHAYLFMTEESINKLGEYIIDPMTATTFSKQEDRKFNKEIITAELIYYWMIALQIPSEYRKWHLNRLLALIRVCSIKNAPSKKRSVKDSIRHAAELNAMRRSQYNTTG